MAVLSRKHPKVSDGGEDRRGGPDVGWRESVPPDYTWDEGKSQKHQQVTRLGLDAVGWRSAAEAREQPLY